MYDNIRFVNPNMEFVDGYFFTMDQTRESLIQKLADGRTAFEYPCSNRIGWLIYTDNFNTNTYNPDMWDLTGTEGGFRDGKFWSRDGSSGDQTALHSKFRAKGGFDVRIDYEIIYSVDQSWWGVQLNLQDMDSAPNYTYLQTRRDRNNTYKCDYKDAGGTWHSVASPTTSDIIGGLRFKRAYNSDRTYAYYKSGVTGNWVNFGSTNEVGIGDHNNIKVRIYTTNGTNYPDIEAEFDNFYMSIELSAVKSLQYDGTYFWTLQEILGTEEPVIRKWLIRNYVCEIVQELILTNTTGTIFDSDAFAIENYRTILSTTASGGAVSIRTDEYYDTVITSGSVMTLGPNGDGAIEDITVSGVVYGDIILDSPLTYTYTAGDKVITTPSFFLFNNYTGTSSTNGSLIRFDAHDGLYLTADSLSEYKNVTSATFARVQNLLRGYTDATSVIFVKNTEARFRNMSDLIARTDAYSVNDDFTDVDDSIPDTDLWNITQGNPRIFDNALFCSTVIGGYDELTSNYLVTGDFDVQISGSLPTPYEFQTFSVSDDFTGVSGSLLDDSLWYIDNNSVSGIAIIYNNKLRISIPETPNDEYVGVVSKFYLHGDFDIQFDYEEISNDPPSSSYSYPVNMRVYGENNICSIVGIWMDSASNTYMMVDGVITPQIHASTVYTSGKLRMTRTGSVIKSYYWTGSGWEWNGSTSGFIHSESFVEDAYVVIRTHADYDSGATTDYSNFIVTYGRGVVSDSFTGVSGSPDVIKWNYSYPDLSSLVNNKLEMNVDVNNVYCDVSSRYYIKGDFDVQVDYELIDFPDIDNCRCTMEMRTVSDGWRYRCHRGYNGADRYAAEQYNGSSWSNVGQVSTTHTSGKLRMTRVDSTITNYYWNSGSWTSFYTWSSASTDQVVVLLEAYVHNNFPTIKINFDNFTINSADEITYFYYLHGLRLKFPYNSNYWYELTRRDGFDDMENSFITRYNNGALTNNLQDTTTAENYMLRLKRTGSTIYSYYKNIIGGIVPSTWTSIGSISYYDSDCTISPYLYSNNITISSSYFDDLEYNSGTIRYQLITTPYYGVMNIDNIRSNGSTIIPVYDLSYSNGNLYRLQDEGTYYGTDNDWGSQYNYVCSPVRSFIDAISIEACPIILPANGRNISQINCVVVDQYANGALNRPITFTDTDDYGYITINPQYTDYIYGTGEATTYYRAGVEVHTVTIQGTVTQYD